MEIVRKLHEAFKSKGLRLSIAESCTAGLISHMLTSEAGASHFFDSSVICYSIHSKRKLLGIKSSLLRKHGAISEEAVRAMAEAIRGKTGTDFSLAVAGNLGPAAMEEKPVGLVFVAIAFSAETTSRGFMFEGTRQEIKERTAETALEFLYEAISVWTT